MNRRELLARALGLVPATLVSGTLWKGAGIAAEYLAELQKSHPTADANWKFYECAGQLLFPIYHEGGSLSTKMVCYLVRPKLLKRGYFRQETKWDNADLGRGSGSQWGWEALAVGFNDLEFAAVGDDEKAIQRLVNMKIERATSMGKPVEVDMNGGSLPLPEEENYVPTR